MPGAAASGRGSRTILQTHRGRQQPALLRALVASELELRRQLGERPAIEEYLARFPADAELIRSAFSEDAATISASPAARRRHRHRRPRQGTPRYSPASLRSPTGSGRSLGKQIWAWPLLRRPGPDHRRGLGTRHRRAGHARPDGLEALGPARCRREGARAIVRRASGGRQDRCE